MIVHKLKMCTCLHWTNFLIAHLCFFFNFSTIKWNSLKNNTPIFSTAKKLSGSKKYMCQVLMLYLASLLAKIKWYTYTDDQLAEMTNQKFCSVYFVHLSWIFSHFWWMLNLDIIPSKMLRWCNIFIFLYSNFACWLFTQDVLSNRRVIVLWLPKFQWLVPSSAITYSDPVYRDWSLTYR